MLKNSFRCGFVKRGLIFLKKGQDSLDMMKILRYCVLGPVSERRTTYRVGLGCTSPSSAGAKFVLLLCLDGYQGLWGVLQAVCKVPENVD